VGVGHRAELLFAQGVRMVKRAHNKSPFQPQGLIYVPRFPYRYPIGGLNASLFYGKFAFSMAPGGL
jgi:hypothetical protein